ncbi:DnaJ central domain protein, partial [Ostertagia ostertagi]
ERRRRYDIGGLDAIKEGGGGGGFGGDLFSHIFGDDDDSPFSGFFGMGGGGRRRTRRKFQDTVYPLNVTLEEVYMGKTSKLRLSKKALCTKCKGTGGKTGQSYECHSCRGRGVKNLVQQIGPGMVQQMQVRCNDCGGEGSRIPESDKCSNCRGEKSEEVKKILEVHVEPGMRHNDKITFPGEGDQSDPQTLSLVTWSLSYKTISLNEALCGYEIPLKHLDGRTLILKNKPGDIITPDCVRGIVGEGMPQRRHHDIRGNLYVKFDVTFPNDHFLEDETKYKIIESAFPPVRKIAHPPNCEEVSVDQSD